ncbi:unnamed protein product [Didymodactylos carnosus]|uniref:Uncharacterized protein n=1 Tax=Didymodactylos carnosus TaxID=1234261 RepID=A0A814U4T6_9BILA|nr:unnamed protein product [Didymodactylos carnosus]CAF1168997.1 unnamed protein product [Didymodactylos carnosus]CAF3752713.1 unnamed protein product [Didymodactylos carnosus]CAF3932698.1 unnamed protein product [Didymodactylos carnosus]
MVTGGASGIGYATVNEFAKEGATVAIFDYDEEIGKKAEEQLRSEGKNVTFYKVDVCSFGDVKNAVYKFAEQNGGVIHHLVNGAATFIFKGLDATLEDFNKTFTTNVSGYAFTVQAVHPFMKKAGGKGCSIINIASVSGSRPEANKWTYNSSKAAVLTLTKCMALDLSKDGIRVNSVSPAGTWTSALLNTLPGPGGREKWEPIFAPQYMLHRCAEPIEIARPILFLCSEDASFITAIDLPIDGGHM